MANILITAPSLDENVNISGISSLTKTIITWNSTSQNYYHFTIGKKDGEGKGLGWLMNQLTLIPRFVGFVKQNKIDFIHLNTDFTPASVVRDYLILMTAKKILRKRILMHIHGGYLLMSPPKRGGLLHFLISSMLKNAEIRVVLSAVEQKEIQTTYGVECVAMPNAVEVIDQLMDKDFSGKLSLLFMGRIVKSKGIFLLAECLKELTVYFKEISLRVYGTGPDLPEFQQKLSEIKGLSYEYGGIAKGDSKMQAFKDAHVFVLPSLYGEGLPIAMLESMNYGCVPVVSDDASIGTVVQDGCNGYLVGKGSLTQLKDKLTSVFENRGKLQELSESAKQTIKNSYNLHNYISALNQLYTKH